MNTEYKPVSPDYVEPDMPCSPQSYPSTKIAKAVVAEMQATAVVTQFPMDSQTRAKGVVQATAVVTQFPKDSQTQTSAKRAAAFPKDRS